MEQRRRWKMLRTRASLRRLAPPSSFHIWAQIQLTTTNIDSASEAVEPSKGPLTAGQSRVAKVSNLSNWTLNKSTFLVFWTFLWSKVSSTVHVFQLSTNILNVPLGFSLPLWRFFPQSHLTFECDRRSEKTRNFHNVKETFSKLYPSEALPELYDFL